MSFDFVFSSIWQYDTSHVMADPGVRHYRWDVDLTPTQLAVSVIDDDVVNRLDDLLALNGGEQIALRSTSTAMDWGLFEVLGISAMGVAPNPPTWVLIDVAPVEAGELHTAPSGNNRVLFDFLRLAEPPVPAIGPIANSRDEIIDRVASLLHVDSDDVWATAAVDSAIEYTIDATGRNEVGLPDSPLTVNGLVLFAQKLYTDSPNGAQVAIGDDSFEPIFQPESLWKHVRHYFDHLDVSYGVA